jgi:hypothetical protein
MGCSLEKDELAPALMPCLLCCARYVQSEDMKDKLLRTLADMENLRERTARTAAEAKQYATQVRGED